MTDESGSNSKATPKSAATLGPVTIPAITPTLAFGTKPPKLPAPGKTFDPRSVEKSRNNMLDSVMSLTYPANSIYSTLATNRLGLAAMANGCGNERPTRALVNFSDDNQYMFIMPVSDHAKAIKITYDGNQAACINLFKPFAQFNKKATKGMREYYAVEVTDQPVVIEEVTGFALWIHLKTIAEQPIKSRKTDEQK